MYSAVDNVHPLLSSWLSIIHEWGREEEVTPRTDRREEVVALRSGSEEELADKRQWRRGGGTQTERERGERRQQHTEEVVALRRGNVSEVAEKWM